MSTQFIGQLNLVGFNFAPYGWAFCNGQTLAISEYEALFNLIGTIYGGDGVSTFNLPNLQSRTPVGVGQGPGLSNYVIGQTQGAEAVTLTSQQMPTHTHTMPATSNQANAGSPSGAIFSAAANSAYGTGGSATILNVASVTGDGGSQPHDNIQPYQTLNWIIALEGIFPSRG